MEKINLGDKVKDVITGFTGIAVSSTKWLWRCTRIGIQSQTLKDGAPIDLEWIDVDQLVVIEKNAIHAGSNSAGIGGPQADPPSSMPGEK